MSVKVIYDKFTGRSRRFGFVEMESGAEAQKGMDALNGSDLDGRNLVVDEARPQKDRGGGRGPRRGGWSRRW